MSVNFQAQAILDIAEKEKIAGAPSPEELGAKGLRIVFKESRGSLTPEVPDVGYVEDFSIQGPGGKIPVRYLFVLFLVAGKVLENHLEQEKF